MRWEWKTRILSTKLCTIKLKKKRNIYLPNILSLLTKATWLPPLIHTSNPCYSDCDIRFYSLSFQMYTQFC